MYILMKYEKYDESSQPLQKRRKELLSSQFLNIFLLSYERSKQKNEWSLLQPLLRSKAYLKVYLKFK